MIRRAVVVSAPAMFGRLPDQRDYVRWRVSANEGQIWQAWLNQQTWLGQGRHIVLPDGADTAKAGENDGWMRLSPQETALPEHHPLPWSFVLSPGFLPIGGRDEWLTGVLTASRDSTGRPWPLVIYQRAGREWLEESLDDTQGWLYWLARATGRAGRPALGDVATGAALGAVAARLATCTAAQPGTHRAAGRAGSGTARCAPPAMAGLAGQNADAGAAGAGLVLAAEQRGAVCGCVAAGGGR